MNSNKLIDLIKRIANSDNQNGVPLWITSEEEMFLQKIIEATGVVIEDNGEKQYNIIDDINV